jgi:hypothetical protein
MCPISHPASVLLARPSQSTCHCHVTHSIHFMLSVYCQTFQMSVQYCTMAVKLPLYRQRFHIYPANLPVSCQPFFKYYASNSSSVGSSICILSAIVYVACCQSVYCRLFPMFPVSQSAILLSAISYVFCQSILYCHLFHMYPVSQSASVLSAISYISCQSIFCVLYLHYFEI